MLDAGDSWRVAILIVCLLLSGFFSASETAYIALSRARLTNLVNQGQPGARRVSRLAQHPERFLATVLLSNNLVNTAAAAIATVLVLNLVNNDSLALLVSTVGVTAFVLLFGETLPKSIAWNRSEAVAFAVSRPLILVGFILAPAIWFLQGFSKLSNRALGITGRARQVGEEEIRIMIAAGAQTGAVEAAEAALLEKVFRFGDRQLREIMTPRPEIVWVERGTTLGEFLTIYAGHSHTRFPVYEGTMENVIGVLSVKDVLTGMGQSPSASDAVTGMVRPAYFVPETKSVSDTFSEMRQAGYTVALTVDEFGGIAGLATMKQLLEVIVGQVGEEGVMPEEAVKPLGKDTFRMDAGVAISEINEEMDLDLPEGDYQTLAGFVLDRLGRIPEEGDVVEFRNLHITVTVMDGVRIEEVELRRVPLGRSEVGT